MMRKFYNNYGGSIGAGFPGADAVGQFETKSTLGKRLVATGLIFSVLFAGCKKEQVVADETKLTVNRQSVANQALAEDEYFQMAVIPDTQYYMSEDSHDGKYYMFQDQITWIRANKTTSKISYVAHVGDIVDDGETDLNQWVKAKNEIYKLETDNIPYGLAVGNHDQTPFGDAGQGATNNGYGAYFGKSHFTGKSWYGGAYGSSDNNDNHYDKFTANGVNYLVLYIEFNEPGYTTDSDPTVRYRADITTDVSAWANGILATYPTYKAIIVSHSILKPSTSGNHQDYNAATNNAAGAFTPQGQQIYDLIAKNNANVFLMLCGHKTGEGFLKTNYNGHIIKTYLADFQGRPAGGNGNMRLMKFNKTQQTLGVRTFAPKSGPNILETDADSEFSDGLYN
ncbi:metallophosphoesterase [Pedobacter sp. GSP4]|uniref:metallophosphoesterase n=1 Tax=Pedobacter sp. GSP4 TaxID=3453716 RepID=UPI003EEF7670